MPYRIGLHYKIKYIWIHDVFSLLSSKKESQAYEISSLSVCVPPNNFWTSW
jgi:hypothetical protein